MWRGGLISNKQEAMLLQEVTYTESKFQYLKRLIICPIRIIRIAVLLKTNNLYKKKNP